MKAFIERSDLTPFMAPSQDWLKRNCLSGILFIELPSKTDLETIVDQIAPEAPLNIKIAHAEFDREINVKTIENKENIFQNIFNIIYEEIFIEVISGNKRFIVWIPSEHKFYGVFGNADDLLTAFGERIAVLRAEILAFAHEPFFNKRIRDYITSAVTAYFTL